MHEFIRKNYVETHQEKSLYNINSFRGLQSDKNKLDREARAPLSVISPRIIPNGGVDKVENGDARQKREMKPRLLTGKLPAAFGVKYKK